MPLKASQMEFFTQFSEARQPSSFAAMQAPSLTLHFPSILQAFEIWQSASVATLHAPSGVAVHLPSFVHSAVSLQASFCSHAVEYPASIVESSNVVKSLPRRVMGSSTFDWGHKRGAR
jgi:hypothetical protein